jgi:long-subunit fatty acid transport protein
LSKADFNLDKNMPDSLTLNTYTKWVNQYAMRFGIEYEVTKDISILGGYQYKTAPFIPYGNAIRDEGPQTQTYSFGFSINILDGRLDAAYTYYQLKYYDAYMNNRNFTLERTQKISLGYTYTL